MSHTPISSTPSGNAANPANLHTAQQDKKPSLTGVRIKQRKGQAKASAKFEPEVFRDALLLHLSLLPSPPTTDALVTKLVQAGSTLEFLKYYEQLFELFFVGGLLQPGGSYVDDKRSPVYLLQASEEGTGGVKGMVDVMKRVIQRYKYLQKPLEENFLPDLLQYLPKWDPESRIKLADATALLILELPCSAKCFQSLAKDHVVKDNIALEFLTNVFRTYLSRQSMDHLAASLRRSGLKDISLVFPQPVRDRKHLEDHFKQAGLPQVNEWYAKVVLSEIKEETMSSIERMVNEEDSNDAIIDYLKTQQAENAVPEADLVEWIWLAFMQLIDWSARADQLDTLVVSEVTRLAPILEAFCNSAKSQVGLINAVQVYCYTDTRILKAFPGLLKVFYNTDCVSDQAIIYWAQKGAKPNGKQHFLKATEALVKFLEEQESDEE
ncbi:hypothetical protein P7C73_g6150, partial [Tremellales sp. Uapishka_1]